MISLPSKVTVEPQEWMEVCVNNQVCWDYVLHKMFTTTDCPSVTPMHMKACVNNQVCWDYVPHNLVTTTHCIV